MLQNGKTWWSSMRVWSEWQRLCSLLCRTPAHQCLQERSFSTPGDRLCAATTQKAPLIPWLCRPGSLEFPGPVRLWQREGKSLVDIAPRALSRPYAETHPSLSEKEAYSAWGVGSGLQRSQGPEQRLPRNGDWWIQSLYSALPQITASYREELTPSPEPWFLWLLPGDTCAFPGSNVQQDFCFQVPQDCNQ